LLHERGRMRATPWKYREQLTILPARFGAVA
jgi:hypothetical protein